MESKELSEAQKATSAALKFLAARPRSVSEMVKKLKLKEYPAAVIEEAVETLKKQGLLDDEKFAKTFVNSSVYSRSAGTRKLKFDLKQKGVSQEIIERAIGGLQDTDETEMARELVAKRYHLMTGVSEEAKKRRIFGFLQRRGFSSEVIFKVLSLRGSEGDEAI